MGRVASVHGDGVNLLLEDGAVISLLLANLPLRPWAMSVIADLRHWDEREQVSLGTSPAPQATRRIEMRHVELVDLRMQRRPKAIRPELRRFFNSIATVPHGEDDVTESVAAALTEPDPEKMVLRLAGLVGLGEGLTPAADDFVIGMLAGLDWISAALPQARKLRLQMTQAIRQQALHERTTRLSAQLLTSACEGEYAEPVLDLLHAATTRPFSAAGVEPAIARVRRLGHSSGHWLLEGMNAGICVAS